LFSIGVILFRLVKGTKPFLSADEDDYYYSKIISGDIAAYFESVDKNNSLSPEFKDLVARLFSNDASERPSIAEIRSHPWMSLDVVRPTEETKTCTTSLNSDKNESNNFVKELTRF